MSLLFNRIYYKVTKGSIVAGNSGDTAIPNQIMMLVLGLVLGSLVGFLSEIAKQQFSQLESRHVVRVYALPEAKVDCDQAWESPPAPAGRPSECRKLAFSIVKEGSGSVPSLEIRVAMKNHTTWIASTGPPDLKPDPFPPNIETIDSSSNERFYSRTIDISQFRSPQRLGLTVFIASQGQIPSGSGRIVLASTDQKLVVLDGPDYATFYFIILYITAFVLIVSIVSAFVLWSRLQSLRATNNKLQDELANSINNGTEKSK
jgi:hypothetical protein